MSSFYYNQQNAIFSFLNFRINNSNAYTKNKDKSKMKIISSDELI